jgi:50S ribosomal subunit-associated GTPase HflX
VTVHECKTPSHLKYLLVDTVGFLSNIPTHLIASFSATLEDAVLADVILHVRDISHPCFEAQKDIVMETLKTLGLMPNSLENNLIEAWNKIDLLPSLDNVADDGSLMISATSDIGIGQLNQSIEDKIISIKGYRLQKIILSPIEHHILSWLFKEANVLSTTPFPESDSDTLQVVFWITPAAYGQFRSYFSPFEMSDV